MIGSERVIAVIPARGGSKTVPGKNVKPLAGKPLLAWSIETSQAVTEIDRVIVSTDDAAIRETARRYGAEVYDRPAALATDTALVVDALRDLIRRLATEGEKASVMVLLEPTSPLRSPVDVRRCLRALQAEQLDSVATFRAADLNPHRAWRIVDGKPTPFVDGAVPWLPRQKLPDAYQLNGAVYAFRMRSLDETAPSLLVGRAGAVLMPASRSVDIDDELDFEFAEGLVRRRLHEQDDL
jgi:N-acylneuraminate cytidylyltransferase